MCAWVRGGRAGAGDEVVRSQVVSHATHTTALRRDRRLNSIPFTGNRDNCAHARWMKESATPCFASRQKTGVPSSALGTKVHGKDWRYFHVQKTFRVITQHIGPEILNVDPTEFL